jgi:SAM-dependent methyltransferase
VKAFAQRLIAGLPAPAAGACYYALQRAAGSFRHDQVGVFLQAARSLGRHIEREGGRLDGATVLEVGTGRRFTLPVILWLMGAQRIITVDLHRYIRRSVCALDLHALVTDASAVSDAPGWRRERVSALRDLLTRRWDLPALARLCSIEYQAPADAARLELPDACVDYHISYTVLEHIPAAILEDILLEAGRVLRPRGLAIHLVDHSDHFSHSDPSVTAINFLQYEDDNWARLADNPFMYMNRMRVDDYSTVYAHANHEILLAESQREPSLSGQLGSPSFRLASRFRDKDPDVLLTMATWFVSRSRSAPAA